MTMLVGLRQYIRRLRRRKIRRRAVQDFRRSLALIVDLEALEASVATRLKELFDPDRLLILQLDRKTQLYRPSFSSGFGREQLDSFRIPLQGRLARWFQINESCLLIPQDQGVLAYLDDEEKEVFRRCDVQLCAPLLARNYLVGLLMLGGDGPDWPPDRKDADLLMHLANQVSLAFQNAILYREQQERLESLHRADRLAAVGALAAGIAHEVGNPLTAIRSTMQFLAQRFDPEDPSYQLAQELIGEVDRIKNTISSLLGITRSGEFNPSAMDLVENLRQTLQLVQVQARKLNVRLEQRHAQPSLPMVADGNQLRQLFLNLLINAMHAMPEGGSITVTSQIDRPREREEWAHIEIEDTGPGIPKEYLDSVFDPFFTTKQDGTGLGLAICRTIVQRHGGTIQVESREGQGTKVTVSFQTGLDGASNEA
jgi:signal transduction histidine kinase